MVFGYIPFAIHPSILGLQAVRSDGPVHLVDLIRHKYPNVVNSFLFYEDELSVHFVNMVDVSHPFRIDPSYFMDLVSLFRSNRPLCGLISTSYPFRMNSSA